MDNMNVVFKYYLLFVFLFFIGSIIGWVLELIFRRAYHKKWINPGFLVGPYLPIYGFGLSLLTLIHLILQNHEVHFVIEILLMGLIMTALEFFTGLIFLKQGIRLWDYRDRKFNYKGIICPIFTVIWTAVGAFYYYVLSDKVVEYLDWFIDHVGFSYVLGIFTGVIVIDYIYSSKLYKKIKKFAKNNNIDIMSEKLKEYIKDFQTSAKEKYSFMLPFKQTLNLFDYLSSYIDRKEDAVEEPKKKKKKEKE